MDMVFRRRDATYVLALILALAPCARAQSAQSANDAQSLRSAIEDLKKDFDQKLAALEMRLAAVESAQRTAPQAGPTPSTQPAAAPQVAVSPDTAGATGAS